MDKREIFVFRREDDSKLALQTTNLIINSVEGDAGDYDLIELGKSDYLSTGDDLTKVGIKRRLDESFFIVIIHNDLNGYDLIRQLRFAGVRTPVFICSFDAEDGIACTGISEKQILNTPAHYFVLLPAKGIKFNELKPFCRLSDNLLADILYYVYSPLGRIHEIIHNAKASLSPAPRIYANDEADALASLFSELTELLVSTGLFDDLAPVRSISERIIDSIHQNAITETPVSAFRYLDELKNSVVIYLKESESANTMKNPPVRGWQVLYVDDSQEHREIVSKNFADYGIICLTAESGAEAIRILQKDQEGKLSPDGYFAYRPNSITVLICDWRLFDENGSWHYLQGYDIIEKVASEMANMLSYFILTSKKGGIIRRAQRSMGVKVNWFAKDDVIKSELGFDLFAGRVLEEGDSVYESLVQNPGWPAWISKNCHRAEAPLGYYYRQFRVSADYQKIEKEISSLAIDFYSQALYVKENYPVKIQPVESEIAPTAHMLSTSLDDVRIQFRDRMAGRRIALALYKLAGWSSDDISSVILSRKLGGDLTRWLFTEAMCLSADMEKNFGDRLLPEEKAWLLQEFGYRAGSINEKMRKDLKRLFERFFSDFKKTIKHDREKVDLYRDRFPEYYDSEYKFEPSDLKQVDKIMRDILAIIEENEFRELMTNYHRDIRKLMNSKSYVDFFKKLGLTKAINASLGIESD